MATRRALLGAGGCLVVTALCLTASHWDPARALDRFLLDLLPAPGLGTPGWDFLLWSTHGSDLLRALGLSMVAVAAAFAAGARRRTLAAAIVLIGATATTQSLQPLFSNPRYFSLGGLEMVRLDIAPSGHTTYSSSLVMALALVTPRRAWPILGAFGGIYAAGVAASILTTRTHFPSDVIAGWAMSGAWWLSAIAWIAYARHPEPLPRLPLALAAIPVALVVGLAKHDTNVARQAWADPSVRIGVVVGLLALAAGGALVGTLARRRAARAGT